MVATDYVTRFNEALLMNPLRQWRMKQSPPVSLNKAARMLQVTSVTIQKWESGANPSDENIIRLAALMGMEVEALRKEWAEWQTALPTP